MIIKRLRKLHGKIDRKMQSVKWHKDCKKSRVCIDSKHEIRTRSPGKKILVVSPHADDELIGAFCILSRFNQNCEMFYCGLLGYDAENQIIKETRCAEYIKFCESMSTRYHIPSEHNSWINCAAETINQICPDAIIIPSYLDWHWEHRSVCMEILRHLDAIKYSGEIYMYQVSVPLPENWITDYCLMDRKQSDDKWQKFSEIYISQSYMPIQRYRFAEQVYMLNGKKVMAEPYCKIESSEVKSIIDKFEKINIQSLDNLKNKIGDLRLIRAECEKIVRER